MEPLDFLRLVLPSPGHGRYCGCELNQRKEHVFADTIEELLPHFDRWVKNKANAYFALATFTQHDDPDDERRLAVNARYIKSLFIDMDGYSSFKAARSALEEFLEKTGLIAYGVPTLVISGGGIHAYWPFPEAIEVDVWKPLAENFKRLCKQEGLKIDMTVTADAARVLRPPGSMNFKPEYGKPRAVRVVNVGETFSPKALADAVLLVLKTEAYTAPSAQVIDLPGARPAAAAAVATQMFANTETKFKNIMLATARGDGCGQLAHYVEHAAEDGMEPLWRGLLSLAKSCEDGVKAGEKLSRMHPYSADRHRQKWTEIKGPYPCRKFDSENPGICPGCKHWGKITNPLALGREVNTVTEAPAITLTMEPSSDVTQVEAVFAGPPAPLGFEYGARGGVYRIESEDPETGQAKKIMILPFTMYVVEMLNTPDGHMVNLVAQRPTGTQVITVNSDALSSKDGAMRALAKANVFAAFPGYDKHLYDYVRGSLQQMINNVQLVPHRYGWQDNGTFVCAGLVFRKGKPPVRVPMPDLQNIVRDTQPKGTLDAWRDYFNMLIAKGLYKHLAVFLAGTAAPLMRYTDFAGMTVHCCSTHSGTGKTLSLNTVSSVWGNPSKYKIGKGTSPVAMQHHLGLLNSLPLVVDEITENTRKDPEWFANFLLAMTEGKGKERMEAGTNRERLNLSAWSAVTVMSSNTHAMDFLTTGRKHSAEGELLRLLEIKMDEVLRWTDGEREMITTLEHNHGVVGYHLAQWLVDNEETLRKRVADATKYVRQAFAMTDDERYWLALIGAAAAMGKVMADAGIIKLPLKEILQAFKEAVDSMRADMQANIRTADDILWEYIQENYGQMIIVRKRADVPNISDFRIDKEQELASPRGAIMGRIDVDCVPGFTDFYLPSSRLRAHCASRNMAYSDFVKQIVLNVGNGGVATPDRKVDMLAGTKSKVGMRVPALKIRFRNDAVPVDVGAPDNSVVTA